MSGKTTSMFWRNVQVSLGIKVLIMVTLVGFLSQTSLGSASAEDKNVYIDSDGLLAALADSGISATYAGDMILRSDAVGLAPGGMVEGLAIVTQSELTDCQMKLASKTAARYLARKDFRHVYSILLVKSAEAGSKFRPVQLATDWGSLPCSSKS
jgi:hypothetical protein